MNYHLILLGFITYLLAYLIGAKKYTRFLSGFNESRVRDKEKLAKIVGTYNLIVSVLFVLAGALNLPYGNALVPLVVLGYFILLVYVNMNMLD
ncbi:DUF3784 domain-containing protein [Paenibacillus ehimensis]|uniref:DUF3784 domain-containing protein n=1 Tax=Paenibacillus ehimensis TaxID=79264 RepID=A0ABT8V9B6_9BACL|nr:DUF3784 domain-containing protein [Paenibacillus ehimensis]MDO3677482.1 DUF3784 domain-containing protein [Paenibacillus ehimensis]MEC0211258.1 DUF3784 domain-containing protein [Paenibacillus ehimensis]